MSSKGKHSKPLIERDEKRDEERTEAEPKEGKKKCGCNCMEGFKKMTLGKQICICVFFSLIIVFSILLVVIVINLRILMGNTYTKLDEKINDIYLDNLEDLTKETAATLSVHKDISEKSINKTRSLIFDILSKAEVKDYPLNWNLTQELRTIDQVESHTDPTYGNLGVSFEQMTYIIPNNARTIEPVVLQKLNVLNPIWQRINMIMIGSKSNINIARTFIMLEETPTQGTPSQILATMPGQYFSQNLETSEFSNFSWYQKAIANNETLVTINRQSDPFYGGIDGVVGFCKGIQVSNLRGVIGVMYTVKDIENLLLPLFENQTSGETHRYIKNPSMEFITVDPDKILEGTDIVKQITSADSGLFTSKILAKEVVKSGDKFAIRDVQNQSESGALFKLVAALSPFTVNSSKLEDYDYLVILIQNTNVIEGFSNSLEMEIQDEFWLLMGIIVGASILLCTLIGLCVFWSTRKITSPIQKLTDLTSNIKKQHKIEEIRKTVKNHELFKKFQNKNHKNNTDGTQDEIQELISIFYNFFIEENTEEQKNNVLKMSNYEYPRNLYYEPNAANLLASHFEDGAKKEEEKTSGAPFEAAINRSTVEDNTGLLDDEESDEMLPNAHTIEDEEDEFQQKIKPPVPINWEHIIKEHMTDTAK